MEETEPPESLISRALWETQHAVERALDTQLSSLGLSMTLFGALTFIAMEPGLSAADLARRARVKPQSSAHAVARLEQLGMVYRSPHPVHGRVMQLFLTGHGQELIAEAWRLSARVEGELMDELPPAARAELLVSLRRIRFRAERFEAVRRAAGEPDLTG
ncbi:MarR family winged helix-turn-helix transcriptional regulator [Actinomadura gamaensis]|uniref:MarR family winged helix-turn-helix transcriptional regulator n=1 Tax=Actinomadura gamaensis TaxID=1763541 RepID=A0ABV9U165_9ACTN